MNTPRARRSGVQVHAEGRASCPRMRGRASSVYVPRQTHDCDAAVLQGAEIAAESVRRVAAPWPAGWTGLATARVGL